MLIVNIYYLSRNYEDTVEFCSTMLSYVGIGSHVRKSLVDVSSGQYFENSSETGQRESLLYMHQ